MMTLSEQLSRSPLIGCFVCLTDPNVPALLANAGIELVVIDGEHFLLNPQTVQAHATAARAAGIRCLIRPAEISRAALGPAMDSGADGVLVPLVNTADEARRVVEFTRYAPLGRRGFHGLTPASGWGHISAKEHAAADHKKTLVAVQIETPEAVANCKEIAAVEGIDLLFAGPGDLSQSMGITGQYDSPQLIAAVTEILTTARENNRLSGIYAGTPALEELARELGASLILRGSDAKFLWSGARAALQ